MTLSEAQSFARHDLLRVRALLACKGWTRVESKAVLFAGVLSVAVEGWMGGKMHEFLLQVSNLEPDEAYRLFHRAAQAAPTRAN